MNVTVRPGFQVSVTVLQREALSCSLEQMKLGAFLKTLSAKKICPAVRVQELQEFSELNSDSGYFKQVLPRLQGGHYVTCIRSKHCTILLDEDSTCIECRKTEVLLRAKLKRRMKTPSVVNKYTPLSNVPKEKLSSSLKASRKELRDRENEAKAKQFKEVLKVEGVNVSDELHKLTRLC